MVQTSTLPDDDLKGNETDSYDPGKAAYDKQFNKKPDEGASELAAQEAAAGGDIPTAKKGQHVDAHGDVVQDNPNADIAQEDSRSQLDSKEKNPSSLYRSGGYSSQRLHGFWGKMGAGMKRFGPSGSIVGVMLFGFVGIGGGSTILSGSLLINLKEVFHNDRADGTLANRIYSRATFSNLFRGANGCSSKIPLKCKMTTVSSKMYDRFKRAGIKIKGVVVDAKGKLTGKSVGSGTSTPDAPDPPDVTDELKAGGRIEMTEMDFPDGKTVVKSGEELEAVISKHPGKLRTLEKAFSTKASFYLNKFFDSVLEKFHFSKKPKPFPPPDENQDEANNTPTNPDENPDENVSEQDKTFNEEVDPENTDGGVGEESHNGTERVLDDTESKASKVTKGANVLASFVKAMCTAYQAAYMLETSVKAYHLTQLVAFALQFLQAADQIKDGEGDSNKITYLSDNLTYYEPNQTDDKGNLNPKYNLTATDSEGYKIAAHGDKIALKDFSKKFMLGGDSTILGTIHNISKDITKGVNVLPFGGNTPRQKTKNLCRLASGGPANVLTSCAGITAATQVFASTIPGFGNALGAAGTIAGCTCALQGMSQTTAKATKWLPTGIACNALNEAAAKITGWVLKQLASSDFIKNTVKSVIKDFNVDSSLKGVDAGNAIAAGAGLMLSDTATGYGLRPASNKNNNQEVSDYIAYTQPIADQYIALDKYNARQNPFDPENQYSIVGSLVKSMNPDDFVMAKSSVYGLFSTVFGIFKTSVRTIAHIPNANAEYSQPSQAADGSSERYKNCDDDSLQELGVAADSFCSIVAVSPIEDLQSAQGVIDNPNSDAIDKLIDYMTHEQESMKCTTNVFTDTGESSCDTATERSIGDDGTPNKKSQYQMYLDYCTDDRKDYWGTQSQSFADGNERDQDWYSGAACLYDASKGQDDPLGIMVHNFRMWTNYCLQIGTMDGTINCYQDAANATTAGNGSIADTAKEMGAWGGQYNSCYTYGGGHGKSKEWIQDAINNHFAGDYAVDCSAFVRAVVLQSTGNDIGDQTTNTLCADSKNFEHIPRDQAKPGDLAIDCNEHVEVITDANGGDFKTVGSHTSGCGDGKGASPGTYQGTEDFVLRYKGT